MWIQRVRWLLACMWFNTCRIYLLEQLKLTCSFHLCACLPVGRSVSQSVKTKLIQVIKMFCWFQSVESNVMRGVRTYWMLIAYNVSCSLPSQYYVTKTYVFLNNYSFIRNRWIFILFFRLIYILCIDSWRCRWEIS